MGQALLKTKGGDVKTCAGEEVILMPYNPYTEEFYIIETTFGFLGSTMLTLINLRGRNMELAKLPGITNIN